METKSPQEVAVMLGVDEVTIRRLRHKAGLPERQRGQGYSLEEIAQLRAQQRYKVREATDPPAPVGAPMPANNAPQATEMPASASTMTAKYEQLLSPSWDTPRTFEAMPAALSEQLANIARQNDRIIAQNDRIEQMLGAMHARLEDMAGETRLAQMQPLLETHLAQHGQAPLMPSDDLPVRLLPAHPSTPRARPVTPQRLIQHANEAIRLRLPAGSLPWATFAAIEGIQENLFKNALTRGEVQTTPVDQGAADGRLYHWLTPAQQASALAWWNGRLPKATEDAAE